MSTSTPAWSATLAEQSDQLRVGSTSQRVVDLLRDEVLVGRLLPGTRLTEEPLVKALGVSRNTVREALALLSTEGLIEHRRHRGMFVRRLRSDELLALCGIRRITECGALHEAARRPTLDDAAVRAVATAAAAGRRAHDDGDPTAMGTANADVHRALTALAANPLADAAMATYLAQMRLAFLVLPDSWAMHQPYVAGNEQLAALIADGRPASATRTAEALEDYLLRAQDHLIDAYEQVADEGADDA